jgi:hypothetical protein
MLAATFVALLLVLTLGACGGGGDSSSSTAETREQQSQSGQVAKDRSGGTTSRKGADEDGKGKESQDGGGEAAAFTPKQHEDSGGGAAQYRVKGGDNSVQEFGQEAGASEFEAAATALHSFLDARAEGNWDAACRYMSKSTIESFEQLAAPAKSGEGSCGSILAKITNPAAKQALEEEAEEADVGSLRTEGDQAFLIYTADGKTIFAIPMAKQGDEWKVASLAGTPLN